MGFRASEYGALYEPLELDVIPVDSSAGHLVYAIVAYRACPENFVIIPGVFDDLGVVEIFRHQFTSFIRSEAAWTARTILSYPVHLQRLPESSKRISSSVGSGWPSSRAFAETRNPGVQIPH